jgi:hypothetical protein
LAPPALNPDVTKPDVIIKSENKARNVYGSLQLFLGPESSSAQVGRKLRVLSDPHYGEDHIKVGRNPKCAWTF